MEGLHTVKALLRQNDWMAKVDLKDAFFMVPIAPNIATCFSSGLRKEHTNSTAFLLAFAHAPRVFTKILKPCVEMLRSLGIRLVITWTTCC